MIKFYTSIILAAIAIPVVAGYPDSSVKVARQVVTSTNETAPAVETILGDYTIQYYDLTKITQSMYTNETTVSAGSSPDQVVLTIPFLNQY